jgi:hypothetical protein
VRDWVESLSKEDYDAALSLVYNPGYRGCPPWTPDLVKTLIANYGSTDPHYSGITYHVTIPKGFDVSDFSSQEKLGEIRAKHNAYPMSVRLYHPDETAEYFGDVHLHYHLNGQPSNLSSVFHVRRLDQSAVLELERIEVM